MAPVIAAIGIIEGIGVLGAAVTGGVAAAGGLLSVVAAGASVVGGIASLAGQSDVARVAGILSLGTGVIGSTQWAADQGLANSGGFFGKVKDDGVISNILRGGAESQAGAAASNTSGVVDAAKVQSPVQAVSGTGPTDLLDAAMDPGTSAFQQSITTPDWMRFRPDDVAKQANGGLLNRVGDFAKSPVGAQMIGGAAQAMLSNTDDKEALARLYDEKADELRRQATNSAYIAPANVRPNWGYNPYASPRTVQSTASRNALINRKV